MSFIIAKGYKFKSTNGKDAKGRVWRAFNARLLVFLSL
jgi:hypothetical protein